MLDLELNPIKRLLHTILKLSKKDMDERFSRAKIRITQLQYFVLIMIENQPMTVNEIARQFNIKPPSLTPPVDGLDKAGYLERRNDKLDRRKLHLIITKKGLDLVRRLPFDDKKDALNMAFNKLTVTKQKQLLGLLQELITSFPQ